MTQISQKLTRPLLRYFGGKWQLRHWIIGHFPEHKFYAEPFAGAASILLAKTPAPRWEIINDLNKDIINLFRVMQNLTASKELMRRLDWTPFCKSELKLSRERSADPIERARRVMIRSFMGIELAGTRGSDSGFRMGNVDLNRFDQDGVRTFRNCASDWTNWKLHLGMIRDRLSRVMIYERDAIDFIGLMDSPECLLYVDPPYHPDTRANDHPGSQYDVDFSPEQHIALVVRLLQCRAKVVLSGYEHAIFAPLISAGWKIVRKDYRANMSRRRRTECLWISPNAQKADC